MDLEKILPEDGPPINEVTKYIEKYKNDLMLQMGKYNRNLQKIKHLSLLIENLTDEYFDSNTLNGGSKEVSLNKLITSRHNSFKKSNISII